MYWFITLSAFYILAVVSGDDLDFGENVVTLTEDNFDEVIENNKYVLVAFYAPWCGYSVALAPEFKNAATELAEENSDIVLAKVDATEETELSERYEITSYPKILFFYNGGRPSFYIGGRDAYEIVAWLKFKVRRLSKQPRSVDTAKDFELLGDVRRSFKNQNEDLVASKKRKRRFQGECSM